MYEGVLTMLPMSALRFSLGDGLAANVTYLAPVVANEIALIGADFTPSEDLVTSDLTLVSGNGLSPIPGVSGAQLGGISPITQEQVITIKAPAGGWRWLTTTPFVGPVNVFGFALTKTAGGLLLAVQKFDAPIAFTAAGQFLDLGDVEITFVLQPMS
jgi:hypothetical protein